MVLTGSSRRVVSGQARVLESARAWPANIVFAVRLIVVGVAWIGVARVLDARIVLERLRPPRG